MFSEHQISSEFGESFIYNLAHFFSMKPNKPRKNFGRRAKTAVALGAAGAIAASAFFGVKPIKARIIKIEKERVEMVKKVNNGEVSVIKKIFPWFSETDSVVVKNFQQRVTEKLPANNKPSVLVILAALKENGVGKQAAGEIRVDINRGFVPEIKETQKALEKYKRNGNFREVRKLEADLKYLSKGMMVTEIEAIIAEMAPNDPEIMSLRERISRTSGSGRQLGFLLRDKFSWFFFNYSRYGGIM